MTVAAALAILGGLVRLAVDDRIDPVAMPEPPAPRDATQPADDARAPLLSQAISTLAAGSERPR